VTIQALCRASRDEPHIYLIHPSTAYTHHGSARYIFSRLPRPNPLLVFLNIHFLLVGERETPCPVVLNCSYRSLVLYQSSSADLCCLCSRARALAVKRTGSGLCLREGSVGIWLLEEGWDRVGLTACCYYMTSVRFCNKV